MVTGSSGSTASSIAIGHPSWRTPCSPASRVAARDVVLDLSATTFLDGGGLGAIEECRRRCQEQGCSLWIDARMEAGVQRVLSIVGLLELVRPPAG